MKDDGRGRWGWYHAGAEEPGMAAGASGWRSGRTQETTHNDVLKTGRCEWDHAGAQEPGMAAGAAGWRSGRTQGTTHNDVAKKGWWEWDHAGAQEPGLAAGAAAWWSGRTQETTHNDVLKTLDWVYEEHAFMKTKMAHMEEQMDHQKREIDNLKEELKGLKEGPRAPVPAGSSAGASPIPSPALSPRGAEELVCIHTGQGAIVADPHTRGLDGHDISMAAWVSHLGSTLFGEESDDVKEDLLNHLYHEGRFSKVRGSTTKASRTFLLECRRCHQAVRGKYGTYDPPPGHVQARQALATFCLDRTSQGAGSV